ncbi:sensor domain-containing diguanylate cyclase [Thalassotalea euphylliae]|uniref:diguanylate cyclase n=1 Tax=Thalassotalea euphylliae TaxID=1655234 RepID=A0A3E0UEK6_9GAMM|nr:GGDEF domain-containing protein [Thalassotalea euphylliae]REL34545.1 diguanylate cyclase [Thalassotalea euphylliae]
MDSKVDSNAQGALVQLDVLKLVLDNIGACVFIKDTNGCYTYVNQLVCEMFNRPKEEIIGYDDHHLFSLDKSDDISKNDEQVLKYGKTISAEERNIIAETGEVCFCLAVKKPLLDCAGNIIGMFGVATDITERKRMELEIKQNNHLLDTILSNIDAFVYMKDRNYRFVYANTKTLELFNKSIDELLGHRLDELVPPESISNFNRMDDQLFASGEKQVGEEHFVDDKGEDKYYWSTKIPLFDSDNEMNRYIGFSTDVTELSKLRFQLEQQVQAEIRKRMQQEQRAITDPLTGLYNRFKLNETMDSELGRVRRYRKSSSVIIIDVDHFKDINDELGHQEGDKVLQAMAKIIASHIRAADIAGRWGGEEFLVICPETDLDGAIQVAEKIRKAIESAPIACVKNRTVSAGVAEARGHEQVSHFIGRADICLYQAKRSGRNKVCY